MSISYSICRKSKILRKILREDRGTKKYLTYRGTKKRNTVVSCRISLKQEERHEIFSVERRNHQSRISYPVKLSFKGKGEIKTDTKKNKHKILFLLL